MGRFGPGEGSRFGMPHILAAIAVVSNGGKRANLADVVAYACGNGHVDREVMEAVEGCLGSGFLRREGTDLIAPESEWPW